MENTVFYYITFVCASCAGKYIFLYLVLLDNSNIINIMFNSLFSLVFIVFWKMAREIYLQKKTDRTKA